jgi:hypothetical protein
MAQANDPTKKQVNASIEREDRDVLEAIAFLKGVPLSEVARDALLRYVEQERKTPRVQAALELRRTEGREEQGLLPGASITKVGDAMKTRARRQRP